MNSTSARMYDILLHTNLHTMCPYCESGVSESGFVGLLAKQPNFGSVTVLLLVTERCGEFDATLYKILYSGLQCSVGYPDHFVHRPNAVIQDK